ncbi:MAG: hypothetical protein QW734_08025 [Candidatus Bathyarchaeia archaeon]|nr:hypothetical protein [Candidatus Bathyarchaeota archaeon]
MSEGFKAGLIHLAPVVVSLLFSVGCAYLFMASEIELFNVTPFQEGDPVGPIGNAIYFVFLVGLGALVLLFLLKRGSFRLIVLVTGFALVSAVFLLSMVYFYAFFMILMPLPMEILVLLSAAATVSVGYIIFGTRSKIGDFLVLLLGGALGTLLGACIQTLSTVLILCFLAVYDTFAVYHGPVGKIAQVGLEKLRGLSFSFRGIQMGLGDLTFYSMLVGHMLLHFGLVPCLASLTGVLVGCFLAFRMLERKGVFPGLPIPIFVGLALGFLAVVLV